MATAGSADPRIGLLVACAAMGAFLGDNLSYLIGRGRTAVTLTCGLIGYDRRRFVIATAVAAMIWALYAFFSGRLGGKAFEDQPWAGLLVAFGATVVVSPLIEAVRRISSRRKAARATRRKLGTRC